MQPHQQRVVDEQEELKGRLDKLNSFFTTPIFSGLDGAEQERLRRQAGVMQEYVDVLSERIAAF